MSKHHCHDKKPKCCKSVVTIRASQLPYTISKPGNYELCEDAEYNPVGSVSPLAAITINSSDVNLDFKGHHLKQFIPQLPSVQVKKVFGVELKADHDNIHIYNGTIRDFTGCAIQSYIPNGGVGNYNYYQEGTISLSGVTVTGVGTNFTPNMAGGTIYFGNLVLSTTIVSVDSPTQLTLAQIPPTALTNVSGSGSVVTYTMASNPFSVGQRVTITGVNPTSYNLVNQLITSVTATSFNVSNAAVGAYVSGGSVSIVSSPSSYMIRYASTLPFRQLSNLVFEDLSILDNGGFGDPSVGESTNNYGLFISRGINLNTDLVGNYVFDYSYPRIYKNVTIRNCFVNDNTMTALTIKQADNVYISNSTFDNTYLGTSNALIGSFSAVNLLSCFNVVVSDTTVNGSKSVQYLNPFILNYILVNIRGCRDVMVSNCQVGGSEMVMNPAAGTFFLGFLLSNTQGASIENCQFNNNQITNCGTVNSFHVSDDNYSTNQSQLKISNCQLNGLYANFNGFANVASVSSLLLFTSQSTIIDKCQVSNLHNKCTFIAATSGIFVGASPTGPVAQSAGLNSSISITRCQVSNISNDETSAIPSSSVSGIVVAAARLQIPIGGQLQNPSVIDCEISNIWSKNASGRVSGIGSNNDANGLVPTSDPIVKVVRPFVQNCRISNVYRTVTAAASPDNAVAGILFINTNLPNICSNVICDTGNAILLRNTRFTGPAKGVVTKNVANNCTVGGFVDLGFTDAPADPTTTTMWTKNQAFNNGSPATLVPDTNYKITWGGVAPVDQGTLAAYPVSASNWSNLSLI